MRPRIFVLVAMLAAMAFVFTAMASGQEAPTTDPTTSSAPPDKHPASCDNKKAVFHVQRGRAIVRHGYAESRFTDPTPMKGKEKRALRSHKFCVQHPKLRKRITKYRSRMSAKYERKLAKHLSNVAPWETPEGKALVAQYAGTLAGIRACESGGDYGAVDPSGTYYGAYQFDFGTWASVGGSGSPAAASAAEQDYRAALLYSRAGSSPWPVCGQ